MNRKLIRPDLSEIKERMSQEKERERERIHDRDRDRDKDGPRKRMHPPTDTFAESYYYLKQMNKKTRMAVVFNDGEAVEGYVEWYDRDCFKLNREGAPNLLIYKSTVKYLYKAEDVKDEDEDRKPL